MSAENRGLSEPQVRQLPVIGWREWVTIEHFCDVPVKAKVDTGARTSSLHAFDLEVVTTANGASIATFEIHPLQRSTDSMQVVKAQVVEFREIRSSTGHAEHRPVIRSSISVGQHKFDIDITLTSRDEMGFRMLLGRSAVRNRFLVDPGRSYQQGKQK